MRKTSDSNASLLRLIQNMDNKTLRNELKKTCYTHAWLKKNRFKKNLKIAAILILGYVLVSSSTYRFKHPEKTETQLILDIGKSLTWK
jgi:hypothetical protein